MACSWEGWLLSRQVILLETSWAQRCSRFLPVSWAASVAAGTADTTWVFSGKRPCRRLRGETMLLAVTLKPQMVKKPHNQRLALTKLPDHLPLQLGSATGPLTADTGFSMSLHRPRGFYSLVNVWCPQQGHPATPKRSWELRSQLKTTWTVLCPALSYTFPKRDRAESIPGKICRCQYEGGILFSKVCPFCLLSVL